jgi:hypothetical protein
METSTARFRCDFSGVGRSAVTVHPPSQVRYALWSIVIFVPPGPARSAFAVVKVIHPSLQNTLARRPAQIGWHACRNTLGVREISLPICMRIHSRVDSLLLPNIHRSGASRPLPPTLAAGLRGFDFALCTSGLSGLLINNVRKRLRALYNWDFELPIEYPKRSAISL